MMVPFMGLDIFAVKIAQDRCYNYNFFNFRPKSSRLIERLYIGLYNSIVTL